MGEDRISVGRPNHPSKPSFPVPCREGQETPIVHNAVGGATASEYQSRAILRKNISIHIPHLSINLGCQTRAPSKNITIIHMRVFSSMLSLIIYQVSSLIHNIPIIVHTAYFLAVASVSKLKRTFVTISYSSINYQVVPIYSMLSRKDYYCTNFIIGP